LRYSSPAAVGLPQFTFILTQRETVCRPQIFWKHYCKREESSLVVNHSLIPRTCSPCGHGPRARPQGTPTSPPGPSPSPERRAAPTLHASRGGRAACRGLCGCGAEGRLAPLPGPPSNPLLAGPKRAGTMQGLKGACPVRAAREGKGCGPRGGGLFF